MTRQAHEQFEFLIFKALCDRKGEYVALLLRSMGKERPNWPHNRLYVGYASTQLIAYNPDKYKHMANTHVIVAVIINYIHNAGFTSEELVGPLELLL